MMRNNIIYMSLFFCFSIICYASQESSEITLQLFFNEHEKLLELFKNQETSYYQLIKDHSEYYYRCKILKQGIQFTVSMPLGNLDDVVKQIERDPGVEEVIVLEAFELESYTQTPHRLR